MPPPRSFKCLLLPGIRTETLHAPLLFSTHSRIIFCVELSSRNSSLCTLLHCFVTSPLLSPKCLPEHPFSNILSLCFPLSMRNQECHPYKTTGKIMFLCTWIFICLDSNMEDKPILHRTKESIPWLQSALTFFINGILICKDCSQIPQLFHLFKGFIFNPETLCCLLVTRRNLYIGCFGIYIWTSLLTSDYLSFYIFLNMCDSTQYINIVSLCQKLMCTINFKPPQVYLNHLNGLF